MPGGTGKRPHGRLGEALNRFLRGLGEEPRRFFLRRYWYAESIREVAQACGVSESKVKMSLHRTRKKLREFLQKEGLWHERTGPL